MSKATSHLPEGYNSITPYLVCANAGKAIEFYKSVFGAQEVLRMDGPGGKIGHAELTFNDSKIMLCDEFPEMGACAPKAGEGAGISIHLYIADVDAVIAKAVAAGATLVTPAEDRFYGDRIGKITDPFGHHWYVSTHIEDLSVEEVKRRGAEMMGQNKSA